MKMEGELIFEAMQVHWFMKTITLATFNTPEQAEPLHRRLEEEHIPNQVHASGILRHLWFVQRPRAEVKVDVSLEDFQKSQRVLEALESRREGTPATPVTHCPECHSARVIYPQFTGKFFLPNVIGLLSGLGLVKKEYYCEDCHYTWVPMKDRLHKRRAHMAPNYFLEDISETKSDAPEKSQPADWQEKKRSALDD
jgi:hypothetical protein